MNRLCAECGTNTVKDPKRQSRCNPCLWKQYGAKQNARRKTPAARQQLSEWNRKRVRGTTAKATEKRHRKKYVAKYPDKEKAKWLLNRAVVAGRIIRPEVCDVCKKADRRRDGRSLIQAHHDDYSLPLVVKWLCVQCHSELHRRLKDAP